MIERNYAEALEDEFDMKIQSEAFGFNHTISIEVSNQEYYDKGCNDRINEANMNIQFHSKISGYQDQTADTMCEHVKSFIHWMYADNLVVNDGIIYDTTIGGCRKQ